MNRTRALATALLLSLIGVLAPSSDATAQGTVATRGLIWSVEKNGRTGWLVGSLHMLPPDAYPLPATLMTAFAQADTLVEEADPEELASPAFAASMLSRALYLDGQTLEDHVSPETFRLIVEKGARAGLPAEALRRMKPWMAAITLQGLELARGGLDAALGLDRYFYEQHRLTPKRLVALETGLEQVGFLERLGPELQDALVRENMRGAETEVNEGRRLAAAWRAGDAGTIEQVMLSSRQDSPAVYQALIVDRNRAWLPAVRSCLDTSRCFVVVGAAHLVGPDGLVNAFRREGYTVTQR